MKRIAVILLLLAAMMTGVLRVQAADAQITVSVRASDAQVRVGDQVEYTVLATGSGVVAMQFELRLPEGLRYVPNSGATPENLAQKLGVPAADWTEQSMMFTFYNDIGITFAEGTEILRFTCVAEQEGEWEVELFELLPFNGDFEEFVPELQVQKVQVKASEAPATLPVPEETIPPTVTQTEPVTTLPEETAASSNPEIPEGTATHPQITDQTQVDVWNDGKQPTRPEPVTEPTQEPEQPEENNRSWIWIPVGTAVLAVGGVVFFLLKKKLVQNF